jgi:undecaprenyl pyrophosphate phosphatase UppP
MPLIIGSIVAGIVSMFAIKKLLEIAAHRDFYKVIGTIAVLVIVAGLTLIFANA